MKIKKNNPTPKDCVLGFRALQEVLIAVTAFGYKDRIIAEKKTVSQDNFLFGQKYIDRIRTFLDN
ncbi:hypothetical protein PU02_0445 [Bartonella ancashensis]|uniref:Uncharacterized protein n=1 Tax=Bartonella ancashensis TaxID=1318743 RepID=A0A0M4LS90_9HYPH|nr:hypothetical protein PU02_0445 [Bartonella ancashensis]